MKVFTAPIDTPSSSARQLLKVTAGSMQSCALTLGGALHGCRLPTTDGAVITNPVLLNPSSFVDFDLGDNGQGCGLDPGWQSLVLDALSQVVSWCCCSYRCGGPSGERAVPCLDPSPVERCRPSLRTKKGAPSRPTPAIQGDTLLCRVTGCRTTTLSGFAGISGGFMNLCALVAEEGFEPPTHGL